MKNICFLVGDLNNSGGTERVTSMIASKLSEDSCFNVSVLSLFGGDKPYFDLSKDVYTESVFLKKTSMIRNFFKTIIKIRQFVVRHEIDSLVVVDSISCMFTVPALIGLNVNHICWEHFNFNFNLGVKYRDFGRILAARYCDYVVTLTNSDEILWRKGLNRIKAKIVPIANPSPFKQAQSIPSLNYKKVLAIGRLTDQKGFDLLLDAWFEVCKKIEGWELVIVGDGEEEYSLKDKVKLLKIQDSVCFLPSTKNIGEIYKSSSIYCMSSRYEGLPMVLIEAQSFGLPIVSFNCETGPSDIVENGKNGFLANNQDTLDLSDKLIKMMKVDNYSDFSEMSLILNEKFSIDNVIVKWFSILR